MAKQMVIYIPMFNIGTADTLELHRRFPSARFVDKWEEGAVMWQDALKVKYPSPLRSKRNN